MANKLRLGEGLSPKCEYCVHSALTLDETCFCSIKGVVPPDFACRKYEYTPLKRTPKPQVVISEYSEEDFSI